MNEIRLRDWQPRDDPALEALWREVFGEARGGQTLSWIFRSAPAVSSVRVVADRGGRPIAHAGAVCLPFRIRGEVVRGAYSVGAMTAPECQGRGLYARLGRFLYERLEEQGIAFVAGFSNRRSHRVMTGPLGRTSVRPFPWCVRPLLPGGDGLRASALESRADGCLPEARDRSGVTGCGPGDPRLDGLWDRVAPSIRVAAVRDSVFSTWRYGAHPRARYQFWMYAAGEGRADAVLVLRILRLRRICVGFIMDLVADPDATESARALVRVAASATRAAGGVALSALLPPSGAARRALRRTGFVRVPEFLHPQVIRFSVRGLGRFRSCPELADPSAWSLSWADTDIV